MKVLLVTSERGLRGGERQLLLLNEGLQQLGCTTALCARHRARVLEGMPHVFPVPMANALDFRGALAIRQAAESFGADLIHAFTARAHTLAQSAGRPMVVTRSVAYKAGKTFLGRRKYRKAGAHFIAVSQAAAAALREAGTAPEQIHVIPPAIRVEALGTRREDARALLGLSHGAIALGCVAALEPEKGLADLLAAAAQLEVPATLFIVGDGSLRAELEQRGRQSGQVEVRFLGHREDVGQLLPAFDLYLQPSLKEGFGLALVEAMACGVPVIASRTGGLAEIVRHEENGLLTPPADPAALAAIMRAALDDLDTAARRAALAREEVRAKYLPSAMVEATLAVYRQALGR